MEWFGKRLYMLAAYVGDLYNLNRLEHWAYDRIIERGWEGFDTFIRLDFEPGESMSSPNAPD